ncbi:hypothetical protein LSTR_LSTR012754 [Laodelphax striatellus]|uniref:Uncharacterized protein n=1 Tax=Laodelphax striatellus TaxID=195883 RepID=A0A482WT59_LAOST|nr:hypothetical protein LSTR_LSTR012754 [Laodelphax striatellus]
MDFCLRPTHRVTDIQQGADLRIRLFYWLRNRPRRESDPFKSNSIHPGIDSDPPHSQLGIQVLSWLKSFFGITYGKTHRARSRFKSRAPIRQRKMTKEQETSTNKLEKRKLSFPA